MFKKKEKTKNVIIFDIGTGSVGGAFVRFEKNKVPEIIYTIRKPIKYYGGANSARIVFSMEDSLERICLDLTKNTTNFGEIDEIHCTLSCLWSVSNTKIFHINNKEPVLITESLFKDLIKDQEKLLYSDSSGGNIPFQIKDIKIIEKNIMQTKLNGYKTSNPLMKESSNIETSVFISGAPKKILSKIEETVFKYFNLGKDLKYHTFSFAAFSAIRDIYESLDNFMFLDISGEITEIISVKDDVLVKSASFPFGKNSMIRKLSERMSKNEKEIKSSLSICYLDKLEKTKCVNLLDNIEHIKKLWQEMFKKLFIKEFPRKIFFMSDNDLSKMFVDFIETSEMEESKKDFDIVDINFINDDLIDKYLKYRDNIDKDPFVGMASLFITRLIN